MITLTNLEKIYRTKEIETVALENVNLTVNQGEFLAPPDAANPPC